MEKRLCRLVIIVSFSIGDALLIPPCKSVVNPLQIPCKSHSMKGSWNGLEAELKRRRIGGRAKSQRRQGNLISDKPDKSVSTLIFLKQMYMIYLFFMLQSLCLLMQHFVMSRLQLQFLRKFLQGRVSPPLFLCPNILIVSI